MSSGANHGRQATDRELDAFVNELRLRGVAVWARRNEIGYDAPKDEIADVLPELVRLKPQLLDRLKRQRQGTVLDARQRATKRCFQRLCAATGSPDNARRAIARQMRDGERESPWFWRSMSVPERHELAVYLSLLDCQTDICE